ncbi:MULTISPECIES: winged helix DNA-binding domain-containing protein [unclassified Streptomyces]|uniref:winged helix DNA-binding domain-containing protein n=1 Tax=unclassified Streptomyces TaxID=2593676 RepID=UPI000DD5E452|nr:MULTISPECIES: winged helix DNA-binding domain-containing protein [unclassified Streptomyces]QZZ26040.1 winged helix DNA-binding domain-containing protein [Streptomyces sp. ST1015]
MTTPLPRLTDAHRRALLVTRHRLAPALRAATPEEVTESVLCLHATDPASVYLSVAARQEPPSVRELERAQYEDGTLVRMLCMRRTVFVVPRALAPVVDAAAARPVAARLRRDLLKVLAEQLGYDEDRFTAVEREVVAALTGLGEATAAQLSGAVPELSERIVQAPGKKYEARPKIANRFLGVMAAENRIRRGRPLGSWASSQFRWRLVEPYPQLSAPEARAALVTRYLEVFGPATTEDVKWWTGWNLTDTRKALAETGAIPVALDHGEGHALPADLETPAPADPGITLLPALDPTPMGWRHRDWYLQPALTADLFDTNGNIGPTVWWDGRVVGVWSQRPDGEIATHLFEKGISAAAVTAETERLQEWFGDTRIRASFRTPVERRLYDGTL